MNEESLLPLPVGEGRGEGKAAETDPPRRLNLGIKNPHPNPLPRSPRGEGIRVDPVQEFNRQLKKERQHEHRF